MEMNQLIQAFPEQLQEALAIGQQYTFKTAPKPFKNIVLAGLGGSGIGGSIVQNFVFDTITIPFWVNKEYTLPAFVDADSLVIACSYSGNTEETLVAAAEALQKGATVVAVTAGGALQQFCEQHDLDCMLVPSGMPPRACLGYSIVQLLYALRHFQYIDGAFESDIRATSDLLKTNQSRYETIGRELAEQLYQKLPIIYASGRMEGMAVRFRQQLNENSKVLGWHGVIPEMNHNELVGWRDVDDQRVVVLLRTPSDSERVVFRMEINKDVYRQYTPHVLELMAEGTTFWEQLFSLVHMTDWCSVYLADLRGVNATEVKVIDALKAKLNENPVV